VLKHIRVEHNLKRLMYEKILLPIPLTLAERYFYAALLNPTIILFDATNSELPNIFNLSPIR
jgi:hypothetical protein